MPDHGEATDGVAHEIEDFLNKWNPLPEEEGENCPPDHILLAVSKEKDKSKWLGAIRQAAAASDEDSPPPLLEKWQTHIPDCEYCRQVVGLLQDTQRPEIPLARLLAQASMEAQVEKAAVRRSGKFRSRFAGVLSPPYSAAGGSFFARVSRVATPLGVTAVLIFVFWGAGSYLDFFKRPGGSAVVSFKRDPAEILARDLDERLKLLTSETTPEEVSVDEYNRQIALYNAKLAEYMKLKEQKLLTEEDRGALATRLVAYQAEMKQLQVSQPSPQHDRDRMESSIVMASASLQEPQEAKEILKYIGQELIKKNAGNNPEVAATVSEPEAVISGFQNVELKFTDVAEDVTKIEVIDKKADNRSPEEAQAIISGLQQRVAQQGYVERRGGGRSKFEVIFQGSPVQVTQPSIRGTP